MYRLRANRALRGSSKLRARAEVELKLYKVEVAVEKRAEFVFQASANRRRIREVSHLL
jgi:hypothetical protein